MANNAGSIRLFVCIWDVEEELQDGLLDVLGRDPREYFAGDEKLRLRHFIRFCRLGSFQIL